jgi:hypothetical protein
MERDVTQHTTELDADERGKNIVSKSAFIGENPRPIKDLPRTVAGLSDTNST